MIRFVTRPSSFKEVRNKLLFVLIPIFSVLLVVVLFIFSSSEGGPANYVLLLLLTSIFGFSIYNSISKQRKAHESYVLTIDEDGFLREQHNTKAIRILRSEVTSIVRAPNGSIAITGASGINPILIPSQIEDRDNLEMILNSVQPIEQRKASRIWAIPVVMIFSCVVLVWLFFGVDNKIVSGVSGTLLLTFFAAGFVLMFRSKNIDSRVRKMSLISIVPLLSFGTMVYFKVFPSEQPNSEPSLTLKSSNFVSGITIYFLDDTQAIQKEAFEKLIHEKLPSFTLVESFPAMITGDLFAIDAPENIQTAYAPGDAEYLSISGVDLSETEVSRLQTVQKGIFVQFVGMSDSLQEKQSRIASFIAELAAGRSLVILDENSRAYFNSASWKRHRVAELNMSSMNLPSQINIHTYREGEFCRAVTLGMDKFSLPDISIKDFTCSDQVTMGKLINAVAQTLFEHPEIGKDSILYVDIRKIKNDSVRVRLTVLDDEVKKFAHLKLKSVEPEAGDRNNSQITIDFSAMSDGSLQEAQFALVKELFGRPDSLVMAEHDDLLLEASNRARERLPELRQSFNGGLEPGSAVWVKAPFKTPDGSNEWMWVEVLTWNGKNIKGILQNDPYDVPGLVAGAEVEVYENDIFDYILYKPDGSFEGNETEQYLH
jgi:uncharacterized protein YegJ (DUF2314 family)